MPYCDIWKILIFKLLSGGVGNLEHESLWETVKQSWVVDPLSDFYWGTGNMGMWDVWRKEEQRLKQTLPLLLGSDLGKKGEGKC